MVPTKIKNSENGKIFTEEMRSQFTEIIILASKGLLCDRTFLNVDDVITLSPEIPTSANLGIYLNLLI